MSITSLYAQCGFFAGTVTDVSASGPIVASIIARTGLARHTIAKTNENGIFNAAMPCDLTGVSVEAKGFQSLSLPINISGKRNDTYFVSLTLLPMGKQVPDEPYAQLEQTHFELRDSTKNIGSLVRRVVVQDALNGLPLEAKVCLYYTHRQAKKCFELIKANPVMEVAFTEKDIVAMEVNAPGYQAYHGNLILDKTDGKERTYIIRLRKQITILSVCLAHAEAVTQCILREGGQPGIAMERVDEGHFYAYVSPGKRYQFEIFDAHQRVLWSTPMAPLADGITLRSFSVPGPGHTAGLGRVTSDAPLSVTDRVLYFPQSDYKLTENSRNYLDSLASWVLANEGKGLQISGHTDNVGSAGLNLILSEYRVRVISGYLVRKGVPEKIIRGVGMGNKYPVSPNDTEKNRRLNRRVEVQIIDLEKIK